MDNLPLWAGHYWAEHPDYPVADWQAEIANDDTRQSYFQWVASAILLDAEEAACNGKK